MFPTPLIPDHWSPEQALAVYELFDELRDRVWDRYRDSIIKQIQTEQEAPEHDDPQLELPFFPFNDAIPF